MEHGPVLVICIGSIRPFLLAVNVLAAHYIVAQLVWIIKMEKGMTVSAEVTAPALIVVQETNMSIILTEGAATEAKKIFEEQKLDLESFFLRVGITAGGCSGFNYSIKFDEEFDTTKDAKTEQHGVTVVVDKKSALYLDGTTVDFYADLDKRGFVFDNPNAVKTCGCGHSFQA